MLWAAAGSVPGAARTKAPPPWLSQVLHAEDRLLLMSWIEGGDGVGAAAQAHAGELLAALHGVTAERFGFERHTLIGGLDQPNP